LSLDRELRAAIGRCADGNSTSLDRICYSSAGIRSRNSQHSGGSPTERRAALRALR